jgi:hypothetical protein
VGFHDLPHEYLLLHAPTLTLLRRATRADRALLPPDDRGEWWRLPAEEPYVWEHLIEHLRAAGGHCCIEAKGVLAAHQNGEPGLWVPNRSSTLMTCVVA